MIGQVKLEDGELDRVRDAVREAGRIAMRFSATAARAGRRARVRS